MEYGTMYVLRLLHEHVIWRDPEAINRRLTSSTLNDRHQPLDARYDSNIAPKIQTVTDNFSKTILISSVVGKTPLELYQRWRSMDVRNIVDFGAIN